MKTVFFTIFHGHIARNILLTDILKYLKEEKKLRVMMLCPEFKLDYYQEKFGSENVTFVGVPILKPSAIDRFFRRIYYYFVDTKTARLLRAEEYVRDKKYLRYKLALFLTRIFGNLSFLRRFIRFLDRFIVSTPSEVRKLFDLYKPDLVFISSITSDQDSMIMREARRRQMASLGMVRSWDNLSVNKGNIRIYPDKLLVHNRSLAEDAVKLADFPLEKVVIVGMPHFDFYINEARLTKEELCNYIGLDKNKKIILFLIIGLSSEALDSHIISLLEKWISEDPRFKDSQLVVRPHPNANKKIECIGKGTIINYPKMIEFAAGVTTDREFTKEDIDIYASLIAHSAVVISYQGTGTIDAAAFDRPIINIAFDEKPNLSYIESIRHQYDYTHYRPIVALGGVRVVNSSLDLITAILNYLEHPGDDQKGRELIVVDQCYKLDGKASLRIFEEIKSILG